MKVLPSLISDKGVIREYDTDKDADHLMTQLRTICADMGIQFIMAGDCGIPTPMEEDTILYSPDYKILIASNSITGKTLKCAIQFIQDGQGDILNE